MKELLAIGYAIHLVAVMLTALYGLHRLVLLKRWLRMRRRSSPLPVCESFPLVTVQLPLYNEERVAARLIEAVGRLHWPKERLEIQILDDSTDATQSAVEQGSKRLKSMGLDVSVLRRAERRGFKAGALAEGLSRAKGEFIAIFDADFVPPSSFLRETLGWFKDSGVGMVQGRWGFLNGRDSVITGVQALALSSHFDIEHATRQAGGCFFNFNGTAGVWRKKTIEEAGGWSADTLTEDLDLSYRAQLVGWRLAYHGEAEVPSELPPVLTDFISQQKRWAQGSMQTAVKVLPQLLLARLPLPVKVEALFHLLSGFGWVAAALATLTLWPALIWMGQGASLAWIPGVAVLTGSCGALLLYYVVYCSLERRARLFFRYIPFLPLVCIGVAPFLALSVLKGLVCRQGIFHRTPKYGLQGAAGYAGTTRALKMAWISFCCFGLTFWPVALMPALSPAALPLAAAIPLGYLFTGSLLAREGGAKRRMRSIISLFLSVVGG